MIHFTMISYRILLFLLRGSNPGLILFKTIEKALNLETTCSWKILYSMYRLRLLYLAYLLQTSAVYSVSKNSRLDYSFWRYKNNSLAYTVLTGPNRFESKNCQFESPLVLFSVFVDGQKFVFSPRNICIELD